MKTSIYFTARVFFLGVLAISGFLFVSHSIANAAVSDWVKGVSVYPTSPKNFSEESFKESLRNAKNAGANHVALIVPIYQSNNNSSDIYAGHDTPTDEALINGIQYAKSIGMSVSLKPHLSSYSGSWRAHIDAWDRDAWFRNYGWWLNKLGDIGRDQGVVGMTIGTELITMATYTSHSDATDRWTSMIGELRRHFPGWLTYSANWGGDYFTEETPHIGFWGALDYIGISAYYPLAQGQWNPSVDALKSSWSVVERDKIKPIADQYGKPIMFTELGYRSVDGAHDNPWNSGYWGNFNEQGQANDYEALFSYWNDRSYMKGVLLWNWDSRPWYGGQGNIDYTPSGKLAEQTMRTWFTSGNTGGNTDPGTGTGTTTDPGTGTGGDDGTTTGTPGTWDVSADAPITTAGQAGNIIVDVSNSNPLNNVIVDVEIYNSSDTKVFQEFMEGEDFVAGQPNTYSLSWTPPSDGAYTLKVGTFNHNWTTNFYWNNSVLPISVGQSDNGGGDNGSGTGPLTTDIWWPSNGTVMYGVQPLKAMVQNKNTGEYEMYWQVDGDRLNQMYNSDQDYPHKEAYVDFSGWNWKGSGQPYTINFVSKDSSGAVISEKSVDIMMGN